MEAVVRLFQTKSRKKFDKARNLKMDDYQLVFACDTKGYFKDATRHVKEGNAVKACQELHYLFNQPMSFQHIKELFRYKGRPIDTGDVIQIDYQGEITFLYCKGTTFTMIQPVNVPPVLEAETLLENHQFLMGLEVIGYEDEEEESGHVFLRFSNGEVGISANSIQICEYFLNKKIVRLRLHPNFRLGEWVVTAYFDEQANELYIVTGIPLCIYLKGA